jgi:glycosyltransferase involved in cell wall biosynthesis
MNEPLVSVVMVVCNVDRFLGESIESILGQTFKDFEFIIVDFGSIDKTKAIVSSYAAKDSRVRLHEIPSCGLAEARNAACSLARGKYIAIMDADDVSVPDRLALEVDFMENNPGVGVLGGVTESIDATGRSLDLQSHYFPSEDHEIRTALAVCCPFCQPTVLIRRKAFILVGGYRAAFAQAEDYDLWLRIAEHFQCANLTQVVLKYRIHPRQVSMHKRRQQTLCVLAAQVSRSSRQRKLADPLDSAEEITDEKLCEWGITQAVQQRHIFSDWHQWIRNMCTAGEYTVALNSALDLLHSEFQHVERWQVADLHLTVAWLYWKGKRFLNSCFAACHAVVMRPVVLGRPLKSWLHGRLSRSDHSSMHFRPQQAK